MEKLTEAMRHIQDKYHISFTIKDFLGYIFQSPWGETLHRLYNNHENGYCMYVKRTPEAHRHCVELSNFRLYQKIISLENPGDSFFGTCWCGVREFVAPIEYRGGIVGALIAGPFPCDPGRARSSFERVSRSYGFNIEKLSYKYREFIGSHAEPEPGVLALIRLCASHLSNMLENCGELSSYGTDSRHHSILNSALNYIRHNDLTQKITITEIARHCGCCESTLSHLFKQTFLIGVAEYIYNLRIAKAKRALAKTDKTIAAIAEACGFCSPSHFSNAFKKSTGMTALEYRNSAV